MDWRGTLLFCEVSQTDALHYRASTQSQTSLQSLGISAAHTHACLSVEVQALSHP